MTPQEQNILATLNLLVLVFRAQKQAVPRLSEEDQHTLKITKEHVSKAGLTIPVFINTLSELNRKGYLFMLSVFEDKYHPEVLRFLDDIEYAKMLKELEKHDTAALMREYKILFANILQENATPDVQINREEIIEEELDLRTLLDMVREKLQGYSPEVVSIIVLSPFRSIERLLEKMNAGMPFNEIKDAGVWYDAQEYQLHLNEEAVKTEYQGKPTKAHFALKALLSQFKEPRIDYVDIPEFDHADMEAEKRSYRYALNHFVKKHPELRDIFSVHSDHLAIHKEHLKHFH